MTEIVTKSGSTLAINAAPWEDAKKLKMAIQKQAAMSGIKIEKDADLSVLLNAALLIDSSEEVDAALYKCLIRCTRDKVKITPSTFDTIEGRKDYYEIVTACIKENLAPLFESLLSVLPEQLMAMFLTKKAEPPLDSPNAP